MKKHLLIFAMALMALSMSFVSCEKEPDVNNDNNDTNSVVPTSPFVGVYDMDMVYDSVTTSDGTWLDEEFYETMTGKVNSPKHGYMTVAEGENGKLNVAVTFVNPETSEEKVFFTTTATEKDDLLVLDNCTSDFYYSTTEEYIRFTFHNFVNELPRITFKGIYTINLGYDFSYLNTYTCTKRS